MEPPFPGMDPYLEAPSLWPDVHNRLISAMCDQLQPALSPRYVAAVTPYVELEDIEISPARFVVPDIAVLDREPLAGGAGVETLEAPLTGVVIMNIPTRYHHIELRTVGDETLVTVIELLSPVNKRPGKEASEAYERKRRNVFESTAHLLEIDLLRGGQRPRLATPLPNAPYFIFLSRRQLRPRIDIWPLTLRAAIPLVPVPLRGTDDDVPLDLTQVLRRVYLSARYDLRIDYHQPPPAPALADDDAAWLDARLRAQGRR